MKIISLNVWGGILWEDLQAFLAKNAADTTLFCLQEMTSSRQSRVLDAMKMPGAPHISDLFERITALLPEFTGHFGLELKGIAATDVDYGSAVFVRKEAGPYAYAETFPYGAEEDRSQGAGQAFEFTSRIMQTVAFERERVAVHNYHGIWTGGGKGDNAARIQQSQAIDAAMRTYELPQLLCGDLNLWPDTESLAILTRGRRDLIKENGVTSTRSSYYLQENKFADYAIATPDLAVKRFAVLPDEVSDHLALEIEIGA